MLECLSPPLDVESALEKVGLGHLVLSRMLRTPLPCHHLLSRMLRTPLPCHHHPRHRPLPSFSPSPTSSKKSVRFRPRLPSILLTFQPTTSLIALPAQQRLYWTLLPLWDSEEEFWAGSPYRTWAESSPRPVWALTWLSFRLFSDQVHYQASVPLSY